MNKLLLLTVACVLIVSTMGAVTMVSATQIGHSPIYSFNVKNDIGTVVGQAVVNAAPKTPTYTFVGWGLKPSTKYYLLYTGFFGTHTISSAVANKLGVVVMRGTFAFAPDEQATFVVTEQRLGYTAGSSQISASGTYYAWDTPDPRVTIRGRLVGEPPNQTINVYAVIDIAGNSVLLGNTTTDVNGNFTFTRDLNGSPRMGMFAVVYAPASNAGCWAYVNYTTIG